MASVKDYYEVLGIARSATDEEVRRAFRKQALEWHPDRNRSKEAESRFKEVNEAYQVLIDPQKRRLYDQYGRVDLGPDGGFSGRGFEGFDFPGGLGDIFDSFFGGFGARREAGPQRGADLHYSLETSFKEAALGVDKELDLLRTELCRACGGSRSAPGSEMVRCSNCNGSGQVRRAQSSFFGQFVQVVACKVCQGEGKMVQTPCPECKGAGRERRSRRVPISVPAGIDDGMQLRVPGEGDAGLRGGPPGDLYITVNVQPHPLFHRERSNLVLDLPVNPAQAALGTSVELPLLDGSDLELDVPAGVQPGAVLRAKGKGVPSLTSGRRGDLLVRVQVVTPQKPGPRARRLFKELADVLESEESGNASSWKGWLGRIRDAIAGDGA